MKKIKYFKRREGKQQRIYSTASEGPRDSGSCLGIPFTGKKKHPFLHKVRGKKYFSNKETIKRAAKLKSKLVFYAMKTKHDNDTQHTQKNN